jgi:hypothetical protein
MAPEHPDSIRDTQSIGIKSVNDRTFDQCDYQRSAHKSAKPAKRLTVDAKCRTDL